jgi:hypothetical protein
MREMQKATPHTSTRLLWRAARPLIPSMAPMLLERAAGVSGDGIHMLGPGACLVDPVTAGAGLGLGLCRLWRQLSSSRTKTSRRLD